MRQDDLTTPFDVEADEAADLTQQFWGTSRGWVDHPTGELRADVVDRTGSLRVLREGLTAFRPRRADTTDRLNRVGRTRQHGAFRPGPAREATLGELASAARFFDDDDDPAPTGRLDQAPTGRHDQVHAERHDHVHAERHDLDASLVPLTDRLGVGAVDPLLARLGIVLLIGALMVPIALALRPSTADGAIQTQPAAGSAVVASADEAPAVPVAPNVGPTESTIPTTPAAAVASDATSVTPAAPQSAPSSPDAPMEPASQPAIIQSNDSAAAPSEPASPSVGDVPQDQPATTAAAEVATASATAERLMPECPMTYTAGAGDSWYRIADAARVTPSALLDENRANVDTPIFPGEEMCLPAGATIPSQPPVTTAAPATTTPATPAAPSTTTPPTTTPASPSSVQQIIRDVWPDELEEKALEIAFRESRYDATAYNGWCCYGVFQLYWTVHRSWLDDYGIFSASDLYDARKNVEAAHALYQRSGGWGPWGG